MGLKFWTKVSYLALLYNTLDFQQKYSLYACFKLDSVNSKHELDKFSIKYTINV